MQAAETRREETPSAPADGSIFSPFRETAFTVVWIATVVSNIGAWMQSAAAGWLMTELTPDALEVALVQVAGSLPMFLLALPAGALADIVDRRRLQIVVQALSVVLAASFGVLVWGGWVTPLVLLVFTFLLGAAAALGAPAWQAIVRQLVSPRQLQPAIALNSAGVNVSRAIGPALAGLIIAAWNMASAFFLNALSTVGVIAALMWWRPRHETARGLPAERFGRAMRVGLHHCRYNPHLRATLIRAAGFYLFASAYWALLPLLAREQIAGGPALYGILLGAISAAAVAGAILLPPLKRAWGPDNVVVAGTIGTAVALLLFAAARQPGTALAACIVAGVSWIVVLSTINVSAQVALPAWVLGRGLAIFVTVMFGAMTLGSALWGKVAATAGLPAADVAAAVAALVALPLLHRFKLQTGAAVDLTPSLGWPAPVVALEIAGDGGPVLVVVEYRIKPADRDGFLDAISALARERLGDGASDWDVLEDAEQAGRFVETFRVDSWLEHLRQHERFTRAGRSVQEVVNRFHADGAPKVTHLITPPRK
jgi:predicted MFS family arabinose efflux permease